MLVWCLTLGGDVCSAALGGEVVLQLLDLLSVLLQLDLKLLHKAPEITTHTREGGEVSCLSWLRWSGIMLRGTTHSDGAVFSCWRPGGVFWVRRGMSAFFSSWVRRTESERERE